MFEWIGGALSAVFSGGVTGILGVATQRYFDFKNKQLDLQASREKYAHEVAMREADAKIMAQEWAARTQVAQIESDGRSDVADSAAFAASFNEPARYSEGLKPSAGQGWLLIGLDFFRGIVRPGLTVYLCVLTTLIYLQCRELIGGPDLVAPTEAINLVKLVVETILYLTTSCCLWWFGSRNKGKPPKL